MDVTQMSGGGCMLTTALDYAKWVKCLLYKTEPFSPKCHKDMMMPRVLGKPQPGAFDIPLFSLGWEQNMYRNTMFIKHDGGMHVFGSAVLFIPSLKFGVAAWANTALTSNIAIEVLLWRLVDLKMGIAKPDTLSLYAGMRFVSPR